MVSAPHATIAMNRSRFLRISINGGRDLCRAYGGGWEALRGGSAKCIIRCDFGVKVGGR